MTPDDLCSPVETTTWGDPGHQFMCTDCGLSAREEPPAKPVCLNKGGRRTDGSSP